METLLKKISLIETVADNVTAMLGYWDKDLINRYSNCAYYNWFGKTKLEMLGIHLSELLGDYYEENMFRVDAVFQGEKQIFERCISDKGGYDRWMLATYYPHIVNGEVIGFITHIADITQVKLLQIELANSNEKIREQNEKLMEFASGVETIITDLIK